MKPDYKNWMPKGGIYVALSSTAVVGVLFVLFGVVGFGVSGALRLVLAVLLGFAFVVLAGMSVLFVSWYSAFSYTGKRQMSRQIIEGVAKYAVLPNGGKGLDVGCGSGALTISCAKQNPNGQMLGIDRWGKEYASFNKALCESNSIAEGVPNTEFQQGDATKLAFSDESFDLVVSNYVYHNITGVDKQKLLLETLRVLKKGGCFAIHDVMSPSRYGNMSAFAEQLKAEGYAEVKLINTTNGLFMSHMESVLLGLGGSTLLVGKK